MACEPLRGFWLYITPSEDFDDLQEPKAQHIITATAKSAEIFNVFFITDIFLNVYFSICLRLTMFQLRNTGINGKNTKIIAFFQTLPHFLSRKAPRLRGMS